ncbi:hypothetical protein DPMN_117342 [Dreissena polymorpha]|uniref:Uncharacterized protein n=1 Tax=Dreissena polymorpha TaxID=45954 RepID=A0A9D4QU79_DREPO|nr:hypothetical protein DPMN_117342 [Dreissena polymorpha]
MNPCSENRTHGPHNSLFHSNTYIQNSTQQIEDSMVLYPQITRNMNMLITGTPLQNRLWMSVHGKMKGHRYKGKLKTLNIDCIHRQKRTEAPSENN